MTLDEARLEIPPDGRDRLVDAARQFAESPDDLASWRVLKDAVDALRPGSPDPLAALLNTVSNFDPSTVEPQTFVRALADLDIHMAAAKPLEVSSLVNPDPPPVEWMVNGWMLWSRVALLSGDGGLGKSRLALRLAAGIASGEPDWLGGIVTAQDPRRRMLEVNGPSEVVIASWEDDLDEFDRRLAAIEKHAATDGRIKFVDMADNGPLWAPTRSGHVSSLASITTVGEKLRQYAEDRAASLLIIDPLAAAYAGDENVRGLVRAFLASWDAWARRSGCAVLFIGHTPKTAARTSGSTDWRNAVRTVWSMDYRYPPRSNADSLVEADGVLVLECEKRNYGPKPPVIYLDREGGVLAERQAPEWMIDPEPTSANTNGNQKYRDVV